MIYESPFFGLPLLRIFILFLVLPVFAIVFVGYFMHGTFNNYLYWIPFSMVIVMSCTPYLYRANLLLPCGRKDKTIYIIFASFRNHSIFMRIYCDPRIFIQTSFPLFTGSLLQKSSLQFYMSFRLWNGSYSSPFYPFHRDMFIVCGNNHPE